MTASRPYPSYLPYAVPVAVRNLEYAADINIGLPYLCHFGAPLALDADGIVDGLTMVNGSAVSLSTFTAGAAPTDGTAIAYNGMVPFSSTTKFDGWGRNVTVVASAANARVLTVTGYDYLGQLMIETLTINGTTTVQGLKAFAWITSVSASSDTDTTTIDIGWGNKLGLPYAGNAMVTEMKSDALAANAGTFTAALADATAATATNADVRGTYLPATVIPNGTVPFSITYMPRRGNLHGNAQYAG